MSSGTEAAASQPQCRFTIASCSMNSTTSTLVGSSMPATVEDRSPLTTPRARQHRAVVGQYCARSTEVSECPGLPLSLCRLTSTAW